MVSMKNLLIHIVDSGVKPQSRYAACAYFNISNSSYSTISVKQRINWPV